LFVIRHRSGQIGENKKLEIPPRGLEPLEEKYYPIVNKALTENKNPVLSTSLDILVQKWPELQQIIAAWPELPDHIVSWFARVVFNWH
jgi:hypothetical protein